MKARLPIFVLILYLLTALPTSAQSTPTLIPTVSVSYVIAPDIYVRGGPGAGYLPVGRLVQGDPLLPLNRSENSDWVLIRYYRGYGWIRRDLAFWIEDINALPLLDEPNLTPTTLFTETPTPAPTGVRVEAGSEGAFVRFGPGVNYPFLGAIVTGDYVEPIGRNVEGDWLLIRFRAGFGWIARALIDGPVNLNSLPVLLPDALTPSATFTSSPTPRFTDTPTPTSTATPSPTLIPTNTSVASATRAPSRTGTLTLLPTNTATRSATPVPTNTASLTVTSSPTPSRTATLAPTNTSRPPTRTSTAAPTSAPTDTPTATRTPLPTATRTASTTPTQTNTATPAPTDTPSSTGTATIPLSSTIANTRSATLARAATETAAPTDTPSPTDTASRTPRLSATPTHTASSTPTPTRTPIPLTQAAVTEMAAPAETIAPTKTIAAETQTSTAVPSDTPTSTRTASVTPSRTPTPTPTFTQTFTRTPTSTPSPSETATATYTATSTPTAVPAAIVVSPSGEPSGTTIPPEVIVGTGLLVLVVGYVALYWRGLSAADRYAKGFVIERCPVCKQGHLTVETRTVRVLGIPRPQAIVHCSVCRSVLREVDNRRWRYAVDRAANPALYNQLNGRVVSEETLRTLEQTSPQTPPVRPPAKPPTFVDEEE